jgi:hypothetical protein
MLTGERVPVRLIGDDHLAIISRLILTTRIPDLTQNQVKLLLDTGPNVIVLYGPRTSPSRYQRQPSLHLWQLGQSGDHNGSQLAENGLHRNW